MKAEPERRTLLDWPAQSGETEAVLALLARRAGRRRRRWAVGSAALALIVAVAVWFVRPAAPPPSPERPLLVRTPEARLLPDGSRVELKAGGRISHDFSGVERRVALEAGTAHFAVEHDPARPFIVTAGDITVRAVGTAFSVSRGPQGVTVLVTQGKVTVASRSNGRPLASVAAGDGVSIPADESVRRVPQAEMTDELRWRVPMLELSSTRVGQIVATLNRFNASHLVLADPPLADLRMSGFFRADNVAAFVGAMQAEYLVRVERDGTTIRLFARR